MRGSSTSCHNFTDQPLRWSCPTAAQINLLLKPVACFGLVSGDTRGAAATEIEQASTAQSFQLHSDENGHTQQCPRFATTAGGVCVCVAPHSSTFQFQRSRPLVVATWQHQRRFVCSGHISKKLHSTGKQLHLGASGSVAKSSEQVEAELVMNRKLQARSPIPPPRPLSSSSPATATVGDGGEELWLAFEPVLGARGRALHNSKTPKINTGPQIQFDSCRHL